MRVKADITKCATHGDCVIAAPEVFDLDDEDDHVRLVQETPTERLRPQVERAVASCPVSALSLDDE